MAEPSESNSLELRIADGFGGAARINQGKVITQPLRCLLKLLSTLLQWCYLRQAEH